MAIFYNAELKVGGKMFLKTQQELWYGSLPAGMKSEEPA